VVGRQPLDGASDTASFAAQQQPKPISVQQIEEQLPVVSQRSVLERGRDEPDLAEVGGGAHV
jgi:hypothetical protein